MGRELKIIMGGRWGVGKSSIRRYIMSEGDARFKRKYLPTVGSDFSFKETIIRGEEIRLLLWDLAGEVRFRQFRSLYFQAASGAFFVFDLTDRESFEVLDEWVEDLKNQTTHQGVPLIIVGNKSDLVLDETEMAVQEVEINAKISEFEKILDNKFSIPFIKTSAMTGENIEEALDQLIELAVHWEPQEIYE